MTPKSVLVQRGRRALLLAAGCLLGITAQADPATLAPRVVLNPPRVRILRWVLQPGEPTSPCAREFDRVDIVIRGTGERETVDGSGGNETGLDAGWAEFSPAGGNPFRFT